MKNDISQSLPWLARYDQEVPERLTYPSVPLYAFLEEWANTAPERTCTIFDGNEITYGAVWNYSGVLARQLIQLGCKKGDRIGLAVVNSPSFVIGFYGILRAGCVVAAINPYYREGEMTFQINDAEIEIIIAQEENMEIIRRVSEDTKLRIATISSIHQDAKILTSGNSANHSPFHFTVVRKGSRFEEIPLLGLLNNAELGEELPVINPDTDAAVFQYSGGTTGTPKAAIGLHRNLVANTVQFRAWLWSLMDGRETILAAIPLYHVYGMVIALSVGIRLGARLLLEEDPRNFGQLMQDVEKYQPGLFPCVPGLFSGLLQAAETAERKPDLSSLKICISGSAPLQTIVKESFERLTGGKVLEGYGLSEAPTATHCNPLRGINKAGSIGMPLPDVICQLDPIPGEETLSAGLLRGELLIRGPQVMAGYHHSREEDQGILSNGWLHTGDIAAMDEDGYFYILGRKKDLIKIGGLQVWPAEIEEIISKHPAVQEVCAAGVPGPEKSEIVKAWVVLRDGVEAGEEEIKDWVRARLVGYKVPGLIEFRRNLPRTPVGKPLRRELVREYLESNPESKK